VINFSLLDGWWAEGYRPDAGWSLTLERTYEDQNLQNLLDAETIYNILETEILPTYFDYNEDGISERWVSYVRNIIAEVAPQFTMKRMLDDYYDRFYSKLGKRHSAVIDNNYSLGKQMATWKTETWQKWDLIQVTDTEVFDTDNYPLPLGQPFKAKIKLDLAGIDPKHIGIEVVFFKREDDDNSLNLGKVIQLEVTQQEGSMATYECNANPKISGIYEYGFRLYPKHDSLPYRQDFNLVRWI